MGCCLTFTPSVVTWERDRHRALKMYKSDYPRGIKQECCPWGPVYLSCAYELALGGSQTWSTVHKRAPNLGREF